MKSNHYIVHAIFQDVINYNYTSCLHSLNRFLPQLDCNQHQQLTHQSADFPQHQKKNLQRRHLEIHLGRHLEILHGRHLEIVDQLIVVCLGRDEGGRHEPHTSDRVAEALLAQS